jgi:hypothetical protein
VSQRLHNALEVCLSALETGAELEACLALYPDLSDELRPALEAAQAAILLSSDDLPGQLRSKSQTRVLAGADELRRSPRWRIGIPQPVLAGLALAAVFFVVGTGLIVASASSLPGEALYSLKRGIEDISLQLVPEQRARQDLTDSYTKRRIDEVKLLHQLDRSVAVSFQGIVSGMDDSRWVVGEINVILDDNAASDDSIKIGNRIEVHGTTSGDNTVLAQKLILLEYLLSGTVRQIDSDRWLIEDDEVQIIPTTVITPGIELGSDVIAHIRVDNGELFALAIVALESPPTETSPPVPTTTPTEPSENPEIKPESVKFEDIVQEIHDGFWLVGGRQVQIGPETDIEDQISVGDLVRVEGWLAQDGSLIAHEIELIDEFDTNDAPEVEGLDEDEDDEDDEVES